MPERFVHALSALLIAAMALAEHPHVSANQTADPPDIVPEGVTVDYLAQAMPDIGDGAGLAQSRSTFDVGAAVPTWYLPGMALLTMELGVVLIAPVKAPIQAVNVGRGRQGDQGENLMVDPDQTRRDEEIMLLPGDFIFAETGGVISVRQERDEPAVMLVAMVIEPGQPLVWLTSDPREPATPLPPMP